jgi:hypothetical protein
MTQPVATNFDGMVPVYFQRQGLDRGAQGLSQESLATYSHLYTHPNTLSVPYKRQVGEEEDDDIQFISEKPAKRRKVTEKQQLVKQPTPVQPTATSAALVTPPAPNLPITPIRLPSNVMKEMNRRISTGMVGLPTDPHAMGDTYALRGVSMPVFDNFVLNQPVRSPRPQITPELSPKQLPSTVPPLVPAAMNSQNAKRSVGLPAVMYSGGALTGALPNAGHNIASQMYGSLKHTTAPIPASHIGELDSKRTLMPPPDLRCSESSQNVLNSRSALDPSKKDRRENNQTNLPKEPCQLCCQAMYQAQVQRAQGTPMVNTSIPPHYMPHLHYHQSYGQHLRPQITTIPTNSMHQFRSNFAPMMMPINTNPYAVLPSHPQPQPQPHIQPYIQTQPPAHAHAHAHAHAQSHPQRQSPSQPQEKQMIAQEYEGGDKGKQNRLSRTKKDQVPRISQVKTAIPSASVTTSPIRPPPSLIQPTYRKRSPNLVVDVAETCQEIFPFEEVAKRHNVPINKVYDVFAAIIQMPLLRCPTDRRRKGKLANARIREYDKAKKELQEESRIGHMGGKRQGDPVNSSDIAHRLGEVEFPDGFTLDGQP